MEPQAYFQRATIESFIVFFFFWYIFVLLLNSNL